ncbi:unnamed protein product [Brachionus calyciflorus]|uniref:Uncharacterized protein n=1 Tax=Brachionus calyciflorus TaxID=104777 RepID=A0A814NC89_9BILA|nr:unnamed protein product [Brachionus calyciflorus]
MTFTEVDAGTVDGDGDDATSEDGVENTNSVVDDEKELQYSITSPIYGPKKSNEQNLALAVSMVNNDLSKKLRIIGMTPTNDSSNAESIKEYIERIINAFNFDKRKIIGFCCEQGSSF